MNKIRRNLAFVAVSILTLFTTININAATVIPSDYMAAGNIGDTWTYVNTRDNTQFTETLSQVAGGPAGYLELGNSTSSVVYDVTNNVLTIHEIDKTPVDPTWGLAFSEVILGDIVTLNDATSPGNSGVASKYLFWDVPGKIVPAGTFNDVVALVWFDGNLSTPNPVNTALGLDPLLVPFAVTDVSYYARGVGLIEFQSVDALTGGPGTGPGEIDYQLVSATVVPAPAAVWLFGSGLIGLIGVARRKKA